MSAKSRQRRYERKARKFQKERRRINAEDEARRKALQNILPHWWEVPGDLKDVSPRQGIVFMADAER